MNLSHPGTPREQQAVLTQRWREATLASVWLHPGDWYGPAVSVLVDAVVRKQNIEEAAAQLGAFRAGLGVGLGEALDDLAVLFRIAEASEPPFAVVRAFSSFWVERTTAGLLGATVMDPLTGLVTRDYLLPRMREVYAEAAVTGIPVDLDRCFIVIDQRAEALTAWQRVVLEGTVGRVLSGILNRGQTNSILPSGTFLSLVQRDDTLEEHLARIRHALGEVMPARVRVESLPSSLDDVERLVLAL